MRSAIPASINVRTMCQSHIHFILLVVLDCCSRQLEYNNIFAHACTHVGSSSDTLQAHAGIVKDHKDEDTRLTSSNKHNVLNVYRICSMISHCFKHLLVVMAVLCIHFPVPS